MKPDDLEDEEMLEQCPNCNAIWGCEEFDFQECDCCGYPDVNMDDDYFRDDFDDESDFYQNEIR